MYSFKLKSHEDSLLIEHLRRVGDRCYNLVRGKELNFSYSIETLAHAARVVGYTHDLGKATAYFRDYLDDMIRYKESEVDKTLRSHGFISALYTYLQLKDYDEKLALMGFIVVRKHHGDIEDAQTEYNIDYGMIKEQKKSVKKQLESMEEEELSHILMELSLKPLKDADILEAIEDIGYEAGELMDNLEDIKDFDEYLLYKYLFSVLIFADKEDAIFKSANEITYDVPADIVDTYKSIVFTGKTSSLGEVRNSIYDEVVASINKSTNRIMSITVPTGTGKTLTAMAAALKLKQRLNRDMRIIYCLPFTSVIDQNFEVYTDIIEKVMGENEATTERILKHHHLVDTKYIGEHRSYEEDKGKFLIENWNSQIVVTTFMQFFNTIFSNKNSELVKFNSIADSIVLLDEIQSLPYKYWLVINRFFKSIAEMLNVHFILITATQPLIFSGHEVTELVENKEKYFRRFKRTKLHLKLKPITFDDFKTDMEEMIQSNGEKNILIILNTIRRAQQMYEYIKDMELEDTKVVFLSTGIVPKERRKRIDEIRKDKTRKIVVSTQLIEAGVDIDMDIVVRELAPLDSINQSAGRGNREYRGEYLGDIYVYNILADNGRHFSIYDSFLIKKTTQVFEEKTIVLEENYLDLNNAYFQILSDEMSKDKSQNLIEAIRQLKFREVKEKFQLIEELNKVSVFVESDEEAEKIWSSYRDIREIKDVFERKREFDKIKKEFYDNVISVFKNKVKDNEESGIVYVSREALPGSYDTETGYILEDKDVIL